MPNYAKLVHGAGEALRAMQAELGSAPEKLPFPDAPGALQLYHGSPHSYDSFDFENNLRKGEGAMAYGPGGYMTGNQALAEHYARSLFSRQRGGASASGLLDPYAVNGAVGGRKIAGNLGSLNKYFLDTVGDRMARDEMGNLRAMAPSELARSRYSLSMDSNLDPWMGEVHAPARNKYFGAGVDATFAPGQTRSAISIPDIWAGDGGRNRVPVHGPAFVNNPHSTLSGMLSEDKDSTLRYLQFKEAVRALDRGIIDGTGASGIKDVTATPGWAHFMQNSDDLPMPPTTRSGYPSTLYGGKRIPRQSKDADWRLTPGNSDYAMRIGETLNGLLDPHMDLGMYIDRPRQAPTSRRAPGTGPAPYLYTADYGAGPNDMLLYDQPMKDQSSRVQGALNDLFSSTSGMRSQRAMWQSTPGGLENAPGSVLVNSVPQNLEGMMAMKDAGIPATAYLRAGPRRGGPSANFDPDDYNFVIHNQDLLGNVERTRLK